jgi:CubicO group peptidase (beta-lactamase class C family)
MTVDDQVRGAFAGAADTARRALADGASGAVFGVATIDGTHERIAVGSTSPDGGHPVGPSTPFCTASTTKPISGTALGALLDAGAIGWHDPIEDHLGGLRLPAGLLDVRRPTVAEVATHTAGLGTHARFFYADETEPVPVSEAVATLARQAFAPGDRWRYSNLGYGVLETALAHAAREPFADLVARTVFAPLGMAHSTIGGPEGPDGAARRLGTGGVPYPPYITDHPAASEAWCSIDDLLRFGLAHARRDLLDAATHALLATPHAPRQPNGGAYAAGWVQREFGPERTVVLLHAGSMGGVIAHLAVVPDLGVVIAGAANAATGAVGDALFEVLTAALPAAHRPVDPPPAPFSAPPPEVVGSWNGQLQVDAAEQLAFALHLPLTGPIEAELAGERVRVLSARAGATDVTGYAPFRARPRWAPSAAVFELALVPGPGPEHLHGALTAHHHDPSGRDRVRDSVSYPVLVQRA